MGREDSVPKNPGEKPLLERTGGQCAGCLDLGIPGRSQAQMGASVVAAVCAPLLCSICHP